MSRPAVVTGRVSLKSSLIRYNCDDLWLGLNTSSNRRRLFASNIVRGGGLNENGP